MRRPWWCRPTAPAPRATMGHGRRAVLLEAIRPRHVRRHQRRPSRADVLRRPSRRDDRSARPAGLGGLPRSSTTISARPCSNAWPSAACGSSHCAAPGSTTSTSTPPPGLGITRRARAGLLPQRRRRAHAGADPRPQPPHPARLQPRARRQLLARGPARLRPRRQDGRRDRHRQDRRARRPAAVALSLRGAGVRPVPRCRPARARASATSPLDEVLAAATCSPELPAHRRDAPPDRRAPRSPR